jgi:hypothetical protein
MEEDKPQEKEPEQPTVPDGIFPHSSSKSNQQS